MAAFTPVITKKLSVEKSVNGGMGGNGKITGEVESRLFKFEPGQDGCSSSPNAQNQYACSVAIPDNICLVSLPTSRVNLKSFSDFSTFSHSITLPTLRSNFSKSSKSQYSLNGASSIL